MSFLKKIAIANSLKLQNFLIKRRGYTLLDIRETITFMAPHNVKAVSGDLVVLPRIKNCADNEHSIFRSKERITDRVYVWRYKGTEKGIEISKYGSVIIDGKVLVTDWTSDSFYRSSRETDQRSSRSAGAAIVLFSQYQDGVFYGGYYDFVFLVAAKLCRIKDTLQGNEIGDKVITYPLFNASYEREYLELLGVDLANVIDSSKFKVATPELITANSAHWYPNKADIISLKNYIEKKFKPEKRTAQRIYISRVGRRRVINEKEVVDLLKKFDFVIIEDKERSVTEQIDIYYNASFILGPHGASFSNIIWCQPGTHLLELFSPNYAPDFFLYLATIMYVKYSAFYEEPTNRKTDYLKALAEDIYVPIDKLEACLTQIFNT